MGVLKGLTKSALAKRLYTEARKPENQAKAKDLFAKASAKLKDRGRPPAKAR